MNAHAREAERFLRNPERARWHDRALWFVRQKRDAAAHALPEWEALREEAEAIKRHTLAHLGHYLTRFEAQARRNGIEVRWAEDAASFRRTVADILREHGARRVVKSKSMLTEECGLNPHLESLGIEVTDTDLGERIVQLAQQPPSHIVLPAIHLKKEEVAAIFREKLGIASPDADPTELTRAARRDLRRHFLHADAAITGVNFALADEGAVVVCTNEGNADLGCALPDLHIACMGIEKVIPSARDLGVFTRLLARSATGQPITTYTSHFRRPKPGGKLYVIIVDNGRTARLDTPNERLLTCIRCGACMNTCPVYRRSGGHSYGTVVPGPIGSALNAAARPEAHGSLAFACSLCASCDAVCPVRIDLHTQLRMVRRGALQTPDYRAKQRLLQVAAFLMRHPRLYRLSTALARRLMPYLPRRLLYTRLNAWGREHEMPTFAPETFETIYRKRKDA